jgi:hypothetical protein
MTTHSRKSTLAPASLLLGCILLAACSKDNAAGTADTTASTTPAASTTSSASADAELADVTQYTLTMDKYDKYLAAQRNIALKAKDLSPEERQKFKEGPDSEDNSSQSLDDMAKRIESEPLMNAAVRDAGLSPREFAVITMSMMQTAMAAGVLKMRPNDNQDSLIREMKANPANVKFWQANEAELTRKQKAVADEMKRLGLDSDS